MEEALRTLTLASGAVTALVATRMYLGQAPQTAALPYIVYHRISGPRDYHTEGPSGLVPSRVQIDAWAANPLVALNISRAVIAAISGYRGTTGGVQFGGLFVDGQRNDQSETTGDTATRYRNSLDFIVWHSEN